MELFSFNLELRALRSLTDPATQAQKRMVLLAKLSDGHFSNDITQHAFKRLRKIAGSGDELPDWEDLVEDPRLSEEVKDTLREETTSTTPIPAAKYKAMLTKLTKYKSRRDLKNLASMIAKSLDSDDTESFDEDVIRYLSVRVDELEEGPSAMLSNKGKEIKGRGKKFDVEDESEEF